MNAQGWQTWLERLYNLRRDKRGSHERPHKPVLVLSVIDLLGEIESERVLAEDDLFAVVQDKYPVTPGHTLIIARRAATRFEQLTDAEKARLLGWIGWTQQKLGSTLSPSPEGYNLGVNDGIAAGQTIPQFHFHVIPRYRGDVPDPRGGLRWVIPEKARYW